MPAGDDDTVASSLLSSSAQGELAEVLANRYRIVRWLGGGGMGRVYEVFDIELGEKVALKVLRAGLTDDAIERFRREVRLTRRIQHKNVARMFDIGDHAGDKFLTMELVDGQPLTRELGGPLPWARLQRLATQICDGLAAAHAAGVIHRDLKPDNILIERTTDRVVIMDFGIARSGDEETVTQVGAVIGTPRYMSPEQLSGTDIDARADLFSLGVILFELATGTRPWSGDNPITIAVNQATQPPRELVSPSAPAAYAALVAQCIALDRAHRPTTAAEIGATIAALVGPDAEHRPHRPTRAPTPTPTPSPTSSPGLTTVSSETTIGVLPFTCAVADEYLANGLLEDLLDTLSATATLRVRPACGARGSDHAPRIRGRDLGVDHVISGSLRRTPSGLRVSARLISVADGFQIWAHRVDCTEAEVLTVSEQLATGVAQALSTRAAAGTRPMDQRAVDLYLRARSELRRFWGEHTQTAAELLEQAAAFAPGSPQILSALAFATVQSWIRRGGPEDLPRAEETIERALATGYGEAFLASATLKLNRGLFEEAASDLGIALARSPMSAAVHESAARLLVEVDSVIEARHHYETAVGLDPGRNQMIAGDLARLDALQGNWVSADRRVAALLADPDPPVAQVGAVFLARLATWRRNIPQLVEAAAILAPRVKEETTNMFKMFAEWREHGRFDTETWQQSLAMQQRPERPQRFQIAGMQRLAEVAMVMDQHDATLETLTAAARFGLIDIVWLDDCPLFTSLHGDPAFAAIRAVVAERASRMLTVFRAAGK